MNTDQKLRRLLTDAADSFEPSRRRTPWLQDFWQRRVVHVVAVVIVIALVVAGIGFAVSSQRSSTEGSSSSTASSGAIAGTQNEGGTSASASSAPGGSAAAAPQAGSQSSSGTASTSGVPALASRVVQTGNFSLEVARGQVRPVLARLSALADGIGGYISQSQDEDTPPSPSGTSTLRVPIASFDAVTVQVRKLGTVTSATTSARDVTSQYVDLTARISAAQQTRDAYYTLLTKATTIGDTLAVQQTLQNAQTVLEQLQGQQKVLADTSDLATLTVSVAQQATAIVPVKKHSSNNGFGRSLRHAGHAFNTGLQAIITALGPILLVLIVLAIVGSLGLLGRRVYRTLSR